MVEPILANADASGGSVVFAFMLTLLAGLCTGIGSLLALLTGGLRPRLLTLALGFSAGVMLYVSMVDILAKARSSLSLGFGPVAGHLLTVLAFFSGIAVIALIDALVPGYENPHEIPSASRLAALSPHQSWRLQRMGVFSAVAIALHNAPEGLAVFMAGLANPTVGISVAVAIAIHNIPEGLAIAAPILYATGSRRRAFLWSFLSGLAEPLGALVGFLLLRPWLSPGLLGLVFAAVAGVMVYISLDELLPAAEEYGEHHVAIGGLVAGMLVMAVSLVLLET